MAEGQGTDDSSLTNTNSSDNEIGFLLSGNDLHRPTSNPFEGGKLFDEEEEVEIQDLFQSKFIKLWQNWNTSW